MIQPADFHQALLDNRITFFTGVPDSLLKDLCAYITDHVSSDHHVINANEGAAIGLAVGYHLATGRIPVVYLQNSGIGNAINPLLSLADPAVYATPILIVVGWRGEPGVPDEPQHVTQGRLMLELLRTLEIQYDILDARTENFRDLIRRACEQMQIDGRSRVLLVRKGTFAPYKLKSETATNWPLTREEALNLVLGVVGADDVLVSTTGMTSREVFEYRERQHQGHSRDFLTVGSMGHCSQIALGIAQHRPSRQVFCIDGDGAVIMHMGSVAIIGTQRPPNFKHIVINNGAHDSVGGQPTVGYDIDIGKIAQACGYRQVEIATTEKEIPAQTHRLRDCVGPAMLEIRVNKGARADLGRPTTTPRENKVAFMTALDHDRL